MPSRAHDHSGLGTRTFFCGISIQRAAVPLTLLGLIDELIRPPEQDQVAGQPSQGSQAPPLRVPGQYALCAGVGDLVPETKLGRAPPLPSRRQTPLISKWPSGRRAGRVAQPPGSRRGCPVPTPGVRGHTRPPRGGMDVSLMRRC